MDRVWKNISGVAGLNLLLNSWTEQRAAVTLCGASDQALKPSALEAWRSDNPALTIGRLSASGLKPVIRRIDEDASHTDPIKTQRLLNSLIDAHQNRKRYLSYSQSGGCCHVVYGVLEGPLLIKTLAVIRRGGTEEDFLVLQYFTARHIDLLQDEAQGFSLRRRENAEGKQKSLHGEKVS